MQRVDAKKAPPTPDPSPPFASRMGGGEDSQRDLALAAILLPAAAQAGPYPPVDQKRPPLTLKTHGIFWAGGKIVNRMVSPSL